ncbi:hypothetical protein, partial [Paraburkholderia fynbosensis]|uniref:hypothetical protein n=1 Tax=Paraburkholderia fynbosensis TaxID=1200993 RepID=UPI001C2E666A
MVFLTEGRQRRRLFFSSDDPLSRAITYDRAAHPHAYFLAVELRDSSWVVFIATHRDWGLLQPAQVAVALG